MALTSFGTAGKSNTLFAQWERDLEGTITNLYGEEGKFTKFLSQTTDDDVAATEKEWIVSGHIQPFTTIAAAPTNGLTDLTFTIADGSAPGVDTIVFHPSGETARISAVNPSNTANTSTITLAARNRGGTGAVTWANGDTLVFLGTAKDDGSTLGSARLSQDTIYTNPVQIYWERIEFDGTTLAINEKKGIYGGDYVARKRAQKMREILQEMDLDAMFGQAAATAGVGSTSVRTLGGIRGHLATANKATIAALNQTALETYMSTRPDLRMGTSDMIVLCSDTGAMGLNSYATQRIQTQVGGKQYGYRLEEYVTPIGTLKIMPHYNLSRIPTLRGLMLFLTVDELRKHVLRPLKLYGDVNTGLVDVRTDAILGQHTFSWGAPEHHGEINGTTGYV